MSERQKQFECDVKAAADLCAKYSWPFGGFEISEHTVTFTWSKDEQVTKFVLHTSEDYPENTFLSRTDKPDDSQVCHKPVPVILQKIREELVKSSVVTDVEMTDDTSAPVVTKAPPDRSISMESKASTYTDCVSNMDSDDDMDDYYNEKDENDCDFSMNQVLSHDMELVHCLYGERALSCRLLESIDEIDIELGIPLGFLDKEVAAAWRLNREEPLIVRLHLSLTSYLDTPEPPKVEVLQPCRKEKFGVGSQMRKIMENFLSDQWRHLSNESVNATCSSSMKSKSIPDHLSTAMAAGGDASKSATHPTTDPYYVDDKCLAKMAEMGFSSELARNALIITRGNLDEALNLLMSNPESCTDLDLSKPMDDTSTSNGTPAPPPAPCRQQSYPPSRPPHRKIRKFKGFGRQSSMTPSATAPSLRADMMEMEDLNLMPSTTLDGKNAKNIPNLENGFLIQVFRYARQRIPTLNEYCVVCDEPHVFQNGAMLKPAVCSRELCVFAFQTLGVMTDAAEDIATGAEVVDLLVAMTKAAGESHRKKVIFDPFPTVVDPKNSRELALNPKDKNYDLASSALTGILSMQAMTRLSGPEIKKSLDDSHNLAYPLLQWIITSNRSHIVKLPPDRQLSFMRTPHQFLLLSSPPAKEAAFRDLKEKHGSTFAFHGSGIENWHCIIREGLIVASGTSKQVNGAAYGKGVYLSPQANVSFGYSRMGYGSYNVTKKNTTAPVSSDKNRFLGSNNITCIALCEVITTDLLKKTNDIWVAQNSEHVCTRFFFVYEDGQVGEANINSQSEKYSKDIIKAVKFGIRSS